VLAKGDIAVSQFEIPQATIGAFFKRAREAGATTILNPAPAMACDGLTDLRMSPGSCHDVHVDAAGNEDAGHANPKIPSCG
jgi:hypothetical protein